MRSANPGTRHFWYQRLTAIALVLLGLWLVTAMLRLVGDGWVAAAAFISTPINAALLFLFIGTAAAHMHIGMREIIEDYVHAEGLKKLSFALNGLFALGVVGVAAFALLHLAFNGISP